MATAETKLSMKLLIDTKTKKVLFAEVEKNFVDFLFHILSLPVGCVTQLLKKKGLNGCLSNIYQSLENLSGSYLKSKDIILNPMCPLGISSIPLQLFSYFHPPKGKFIYKCSCSYAADDPSAICPGCGNCMSQSITLVAPPVPVAAKGGFVKEGQVKYMVMDNLVVKPLSITRFKDYFNVKDVGALHQEVVHFGKEEALKLLKLTLESKTVLTSLFMAGVKVEK